ncbi:Sua5/YciO/YrdC/YwlC family protein [Flocculibacter collagenilyticus]|uniref:Sua5/YciO/YrdC/YwlC family protein n=1 Tax=Flocculibacter collagenilyticus TaxID=2744479 RepID=UPI0018F3904D|nr:Sua5/YciO/YrdC/YwlC family protein [Flocculibacter collagenilyticus]
MDNPAYSPEVQALHDGGVIAYPTEAVFGFGCDPDNEFAVQRILAIKQRPVEKGLILIADNYSQLIKYVDDKRIPIDKRADIFSRWPGSTTWLLPAAPSTPKWLTGQFDSIAVRVTTHPTVKRICNEFGNAIVSTSANRAGEEPVTSADQAIALFGNEVNMVVNESVGSNSQPSQIVCATSGKIIRN